MVIFIIWVGLYVSLQLQIYFATFSILITNLPFTHNASLKRPNPGLFFCVIQAQIKVTMPQIQHKWKTGKAILKNSRFIIIQDIVATTKLYNYTNSPRLSKYRSVLTNHRSISSRFMTPLNFMVHLYQASALLLGFSQFLSNPPKSLVWIVNHGSKCCNPFLSSPY